jgi:voltage-gated potassium channel
MLLVPGTGVINALYMTVISITTVGYAEVLPLSGPGRLFTIWVIVSGLGIFFYLIQTVFREAVEGNLREILGRRRLKMLKKCRNHIVIAGFGLMGEQVSRGLRDSGTPFVVIDNNQERYNLGKELDCNILLGDATHEEILIHANTAEARVFISLLASDVDNIYTVMAVREINPDITIITRAQEEVNKKRLYRIGADRVISPYELGSRRIVNSILRPNLVEFIDLMTFTPQMSLSIEEYRVTDQSPFANRRIADSRLREDYQLIVVGIKRDQRMIFNPSAGEVIHSGDVLILLGESDHLLKLPQSGDPR